MTTTSEKAEIFERWQGRWQARMGRIANTGHTIRAENGRFTVTSIIRSGGLLCHHATREEAETDIRREWTVFESRHAPETSREFDARWSELSREQNLAEMNLRNPLADRALRPTLKAGDRLRATKSQCGSREASFIFHHWDMGWIVSTGKASISPGSVYSVNGKVLKV
ncbi:hypothetical protein ACRQ1B_06225 [Rhizobium panacihumi]|uniref:hypothetical protein n=1 Tax=Rhizobium panacihumi TaxID=2008450 RepID=UPI003D7A3FCD